MVKKNSFQDILDFLLFYKKNNKTDMSDKQSLFQNLSLEQRKLLYYYICIWVRALIIYGVWAYWPNPVIRYLFATALFVSILRLYTSRSQNVWWLKNMHFYFAVVLLIFTIISLYSVSFAETLRVYVLAILITDLVCGVVSSFFRFR